ncbi:Hydroxyquinol 1,2-dioxygenase [Psilocybe cubensis]|uniref:Hydroxyquinol 1,2-dioxygenase n=2 Tax=Psilocybe cubensis TaxID=181762 RepID=A0ACB8GS67_PSICU|nr:Hydroxyquinol 1,2-dioxygenase [Psilocybe cubensis]KAH9478076.1 Hydroxyquinol 1,2-dioxygenase [Psilocybe cubensis]
MRAFKALENQLGHTIQVPSFSQLTLFGYYFYTPTVLKSATVIMETNFKSFAEEVKAANINCKNTRLRDIMDKLVDHLHDFVRETSLTITEWRTAIKFLASAGSQNGETQFDILSDILGITTLIHDINYGKPSGATEAVLLGPFFKENAREVQQGDSIASEGKGEYLYIEGRVLDLAGNPISGAILDIWEADDSGLYDVQYQGLEDCRGRIRTALDGSYAFRAVIPVPYPIPDKGPAAGLISALGRHFYRPAHVHVVIQAPGYESVVTQLYFKGDPYLTSDITFGVKPSLVVAPEIVNNIALSKARGFKEPRSHAYVYKEFVLATPDQADSVRKMRTENQQ